MHAVDLGPMPRSIPDQSLAKVLRQLRTERGFSQERLGNAAGLTGSGYGRIESGTSAPGWSTVRAIIQTLDVTLQQLAKAVEAEER